MDGDRGRQAAAVFRLRVVAVAAVVALLAGCGLSARLPGAARSAGPGSTGTSRSTGSSGSAGASGSAVGALGALGALAVVPFREVPGYSRGEFGQRWADVDRNGCDTRNDVLRRDLERVTIDPRTHGCVVRTGRLTDPYDGRVVDFVRGPATSPLVEVDHVVSLADAWRTGAAGWSARRREAFANDPLNLLATTREANQDKGGSDAARWLPPRAASRCPFVARQIAVKRRYALTVTPDEAAAMREVLATCPAQPLPG